MRENLLKKQPTWGLRRAQGTGQKSATPSTLTKIILVLLTMLLLPSAAWGQITVAGIESTGGTIEGSGITGTVTFNAETSTLTLNGATIDGSISYSGTDALTIALIGENTMNCGSSSMAFVSTNEVSLSFSTNSSDNGSLTISDYPSYNFDASNISTFSSKFKQISCSEGSGLVAVSQDLGTIYVSKSYYITVGGVSVTTDNENGITGENITGTVKYVHDAKTNSGTLLLTGVMITRSEASAIIIPTSLRKLAINIQGVNTIKTTDNYPVITSNSIVGKGTVEFSGTGSLTLERGADYGITSLLTVDENSYKDGLVPTYIEPDNATSFAEAKEVLISTISYNLTVAGVEVTSANCDDILKDDSYNAGKVSFTPAIYSQTPTPATLTLKGVTIEGRITWSDPEEGKLSIIIDGDNAITNSGGALISFEGTSQTPPQLSFSKAEGSGTKTLVLQSDEFPISGFDISSSSTIGDGLKAVSGQKYMGITTKDVYDLWIDGTQVHDIPELPGYKDNILKKTTATVSFDGSQTLTLNNAEISSTSSTNAIETGLSTLNIDLKGNNSITTEGGYALYGQGTNLIIFTSSSDPVGNLTLKNYSGELAKLVTIQYDTNTGLVPTIITPSDASDLAAAREAIIAKGTALGITVAGVVVTNSNYTDIKGDGITGTKVSFTPADEGNETPAILTLNNASITGDVKFNDDLTVHLVGDNTITKPEDASSSSYAFDLSNIYNTLDFSTDETEPGTLKIVGSYSGLQDDGIIYNGKIKGGSATIGTTGDAVIWKQTFSTTGVTPSYFILSLNKHYNLWKNGHQYHDLILDNNDGYVFNPEKSTLTISSSSSSDYINSGLENLTIIVNGTQSMNYIAFGAPEDTQAEGITTGTLTITGKEDSESSSNSLSLSNSDGGVITGFSSVDLTLPMHVSSPENFTGWTASVTSATITDETWDLSWKFEHGESYATYYYPNEDIYIPSTITPSVITEISGSTVKTQALSYIPKGVPVLLSKTNNTATTATFSKNLLKYAESSENPVTASESKVLYVLYNDQFVKVTPGSEIYYGGYLDLTGVSLPANTRGLSIDGIDGTSAIDATIFEELNTEGDAWHDLQGRRIAKPTKAGLYIINGKKVVLK